MLIPRHGVLSPALYPLLKIPRKEEAVAPERIELMWRPALQQIEEGCDFLTFRELEPEMRLGVNDMVSISKRTQVTRPHLYKGAGWLVRLDMCMVNWLEGITGHNAIYGRGPREIVLATRKEEPVALFMPMRDRQEEP